MARKLPFSAYFLALSSVLISASAVDDFDYTCFPGIESRDSPGGKSCKDWSYVLYVNVYGNNFQF